MYRIKRIETIGLPFVGTVLAAMAIFVYQWMWFGAVFKNRWNILIDLTEDQLVIPQTWWVVGFGFILAQAFGIAHVLRRAGWPNLRRSITEVAIFATLFAAPLAAFPLLYHPEHSWERFAYEAGGFTTAWILGAIIIRAMKLEPATPPSHSVAGSETYNAPASRSAVICSQS